MTQDDLHPDTIPICDYEGSDYRTRFWLNQGREYEDLAERIAIRNMLPPGGAHLLEVGTGFGRLADMYAGYDHVFLLDYSKSLLRQAQDRLGRDSRYTYVAADLYHLPLVDDLVDTACMVRVVHHLANVSRALRQVSRVTRSGGAFLLEFASKLHLKSIVRYALGRQSWNPFALDPVEFVALNFDFHPQWMRARLHEAGFEVERTRTVSRFRTPLLKRIVPPRILAALDGALQPVGALWQLTPSVFVRARREGGRPPASVGRVSPREWFLCPSCQSSDWDLSPDAMRCTACAARWHIDDGIYDFRRPL